MGKVVWGGGGLSEVLNILKLRLTGNGECQFKVCITALWLQPINLFIYSSDNYCSYNLNIVNVEKTRSC